MSAVEDRARVLIVDDEPNVLATLQPILAMDGHAVDVAADERSARDALLANGGYDVVITDLRLADGDGLNVVDAARTRDDATPVVVLTGFGSLESAVESMHRGVYDYLLKPCDVEELKSTVRRALAHRRLVRQLHSGAAALQNVADQGVGEAERRLREAQEEIRALAGELHGAKRELELALARERAIVAELRERDELRNRFIATVSHELRTPLTAIRGYAQLLQRDAVREDFTRVKASAKMILSASDQLRRLVDDLLDMTAIESASLSVELRPFDLRTAIESAAMMVQPLAREKRLTLELDVAPSLPETPADAGRIGQVLNNLLSNAVKFTPEGGAIIVGARVGGDLVHVFVRDSGIGIPAEEQRRVFSRFFHSSATPVTTRGLGLGLYIVRAIVEAHGGVTWVESEAGKGTTMHFTLPLATAVAATAGTTARRESAQA